jgi:hypothetical protein
MHFTTIWYFYWHFAIYLVFLIFSLLYNSRPFGILLAVCYIFYGHLVMLRPCWYILIRFGLLRQEKSGNPAATDKLLIKNGTQDRFTLPSRSYFQIPLRDSTSATAPVPEGPVICYRPFSALQ